MSVIHVFLVYRAYGTPNELFETIRELYEFLYEKRLLDMLLVWIRNFRVKNKLLWTILRWLDTTEADINAKNVVKLALIKVSSLFLAR
jgi:hypothetical protein